MRVCGVNKSVITGKEPPLVLASFETYIKSSLENLKWQLKRYFGDTSKLSVEDVRDNLARLNAYENIDCLKEIEKEHITILDENEIDTREAEEVVLKGEFFWEHAAAGEATRLGAGTKYVLKLSDFPVERIINLRKREIEKDFKSDPATVKKLISELTGKNLLKQMECRPEDILPLTLGARHMLQMAYDIVKLAKKHGKNPEEVLKKQKMLLVMNGPTAERIINDFIRHNFFGFNRKTVFFMIQKSFPGIDIKNGESFYDTSHERHYRLHNHGQMVMQKTQDNVIFYIDDDKSRRYLKSKEFENILGTVKDLVSYNIEDMDYLAGSIDWQSLALSLELGKQGYAMTMEIVGQNPLKPQKGGACFRDDNKKRVVMIESNQLMGMKEEDIKHLNKNFNHYPNPVIAFRAVKEGKMHLHIDVKHSVDRNGNPKNYIYFCTPQGDINFLVKTAYIMRKKVKQIANWKSPATTPAAVKACFKQDYQKGFKEFVEKILKLTA
ncbi:MAG: hypothetical protein M1536_08970 [Firmicutes bacterium]|nr:hypothetical protein [Bacillota bacterium]